MRMANKKLFDQIFELKYLCRQLNQHTKKCEQEEIAQKKKAKIALEKGNMDGAKIHASNAIRKKNEALNYLKLASRLDAVISRLDQQSTLAQVDASAVGITKSINRLLGKVSAGKMSSNMDEFNKALGDLDTATASMEKSMHQENGSLDDKDAAAELLQQLADENNMQLKVEVPGALEVTPPQRAAEENMSATDELQAQLDALRAN
jgi:charged multivesicular body protein 1